MWNVRAMSMQTSILAVFVPTVVGAAAWLGSREARYGMTDLLSGTARTRWSRQLATWAATTCWALVAYLGCVAVLYTVTARQAAWGGPLWWPVVVGAASVPASAALGFAAGALRPSRFTAPLVAIAAFLALEITANSFTATTHRGRCRHSSPARGRSAPTRVWRRSTPTCPTCPSSS